MRALAVKSYFKREALTMLAIFLVPLLIALLIGLLLPGLYHLLGHSLTG